MLLLVRARNIHGISVAENMEIPIEDADAGVREEQMDVPIEDADVAPPVKNEQKKDLAFSNSEIIINKISQNPTEQNQNKKK
jgi:hypothetical protein